MQKHFRIQIQFFKVKFDTKLFWIDQIKQQN